MASLNGLLGASVGVPGSSVIGILSAAGSDDLAGGLAEAGNNSSLDLDPYNEALFAILGIG